MTTLKPNFLSLLVAFPEMLGSYISMAGRKILFFFRIHLPLGKVNTIFPLDFKGHLKTCIILASLNKECDHTSKFSGYCSDQHLVPNKFVWQKMHIDLTCLLGLSFASVKLSDIFFWTYNFFFENTFLKSPWTIHRQCYTGWGYTMLSFPKLWDHRGLPSWQAH